MSKEKKKNTELLDSRARGLSVQLLTNKYDFYIKKWTIFMELNFSFHFRSFFLVNAWVAT